MSHRTALLIGAAVLGWLSCVAPAAAAELPQDVDAADTSMTPSDGLRLAPSPPPPAARPAAVGIRPVAPPTSLPMGPVPLAAMAAVAGAAHAGAGRIRRSSRARLTHSDAAAAHRDVGVPPPPDDVMFVFVVGHGNDLAAFDAMKDNLGLNPSRYRDFDYRWIIQDADHQTATQHATNDQLADALGAFVAGLATEGRPVYLVGFSKGGAGLAKVIARWDRTPEHAPDSVIGAALLDPPISDGALGTLQSVGLLVDPLPDDGFYDPEYCGADGCTDERQHLGHNAGVEVIVVRNPDSSVTNFGDIPDGLRVYDLEWDGGTPDIDELPVDPLGFMRRAGEAHNAVLSSMAVAACISQEARRVKSCEWKGRLPQLPRWVELRMWWGRGAGGGPTPKVR